MEALRRCQRAGHTCLGHIASRSSRSRVYTRTEPSYRGIAHFRKCPLLKNQGYRGDNRRSITPVPVVMARLDLGNAILIFSGLSFLALGAEPSTPEWGRMVSNGTAFFDQWWMSAFPGLAIFTMVVAFNFVDDGLRDALEPRLRRQI